MTCPECGSDLIEECTVGSIGEHTTQCQTCLACGWHRPGHQKEPKQ